MQEDLMRQGIVMLAFILLAVFFLMIGLAKIQPYPKCSRCKKPFGPPPDGFESYDDEGKYCRTCTRETRRRPWYAKDWMWEKMQKEREKEGK